MYLMLLVLHGLNQCVSLAGPVNTMDALSANKRIREPFHSCEYQAVYLVRCACDVSMSVGRDFIAHTCSCLPC